MELKTILARQPGPEVAEQLNMYQGSLREKTKQLKAMASELNMYQAQVVTGLGSVRFAGVVAPLGDCVVRGEQRCTGWGDGCTGDSSSDCAWSSIAALSLPRWLNTNTRWSA